MYSVAECPLQLSVFPVTLHVIHVASGKGSTISTHLIPFYLYKLSLSAIHRNSLYLFNSNGPRFPSLGVGFPSIWTLPHSLPPVSPCPPAPVTRGPRPYGLCPGPAWGGNRKQLVSHPVPVFAVTMGDTGETRHDSHGEKSARHRLAV